MSNAPIEFGHFEVVKGKLPGIKTQAFTLLAALEKQGYLQVMTFDDQGRCVNTIEQLPLEESMRFLITVGLKNNREASLLSETATTGSYDLFFGDNGEVCGVEMSPRLRREIALAKWVKAKPAGLGGLHSHHPSPELLDMLSTTFPKKSSLLYTFDKFTARVVSKGDDDTAFFKLDEDDVLPRVVRAVGLDALSLRSDGLGVRLIDVIFQPATDDLQRMGCLGRVMYTTVFSEGGSDWTKCCYIDEAGCVDATFADQLEFLSPSEEIEFMIKEIRYNKAEEAPSKPSRMFGSGKPVEQKETPQVAAPVREWIPMMNQFVRIEGKDDLYVLIDYDQYRDEFILQLADSCRRDRESYLRGSWGSSSRGREQYESYAGRASAEDLVTVTPGRLRPYTLRY